MSRNSKVLTPSFICILFMMCQKLKGQQDKARGSAVQSDRCVLTWMTKTKCTNKKDKVSWFASFQLWADGPMTYFIVVGDLWRYFISTLFLCVFRTSSGKGEHQLRYGVWSLVWPGQTLRRNLQVFLFLSFFLHKQTFLWSERAPWERFPASTEFLTRSSTSFRRVQEQVRNSAGESQV